MSAFTIAALLGAYVAMGFLCVIAGAYLSALRGGTWFTHPTERWAPSAHGSDTIWAAFVVPLWPFFIIFWVVAGMGYAAIKAVETAADAAIRAGKAQERRLRGAKKA
jgi:hypothetical protein